MVITEITLSCNISINLWDNVNQNITVLCFFFSLRKMKTFSQLK